MRVKYVLKNTIFGLAPQLARYSTSIQIANWQSGARVHIWAVVIQSDLVFGFPGSLYAIKLRSSVRVSSSGSSLGLTADKKSNPRKCTSGFTSSHFLLQNYGKQVQSNLHVRPPVVSDRQSKTPKFSQSKPYSWNL